MLMMLLMIEGETFSIIHNYYYLIKCFFSFNIRPISILFCTSSHCIAKQFGTILFFYLICQKRLDLTVQGNHRSNPVSTMECSDITYYTWLVLIHMPYMHRFHDSGCWKSCDLDLTFQGHYWSNLIINICTNNMPPSHFLYRYIINSINKPYTGSNM